MITRQYTPPTCTLEVTARSPLIPRLLKRPVLENFGFKLRFDDPRLTEENYVTVKGDRPQLDQLYQAVISCVKTLLRFPPQLQSVLEPSPESSGVLVTVPEQTVFQESSEQSLRQFPKQLSNGLFHDSSEGLCDSPKDSLAASWKDLNPNLRSSQPTSDIYLKPDGLLYHNLFLGSLADEQSGPYVQLSAVQLFDLVTALEEFTHDLALVPLRETASISGKQLFLSGLRTALTILMGIGASTGLIKLVAHHQQSGDLTATQKLESPALSPPNLVAEPAIPSWQTPLPAPPAAPPVNVAPNLPPVNTAPLAVPPPLFSVPPTLPPANSIPNVALGTDGTMVISTNPTPLAAVSAPPPEPILPSQAIAPTPVPGTLNPGTPNPGTLSPRIIQLPTLESTDPPAILQIPTSETQAIAAAQERAGVNALKDSDESVQGVQGDPTETPEAESQGSLEQLEKRPQTVAAQRQENTALLDQIPQVEEVRSYFQQAWYPPKHISRALQYTLKLNADGSIQSITPVGQASLNRLPQLTLPSAGEPFVSPTQNSTTPKIRVVLEPSGRVRTFLESLN
ncbi:MAG: DUF4335 domain-containing protein [Microcoleaceae cyanobacterium]